MRISTFRTVRQSARCSRCRRSLTTFTRSDLESIRAILDPSPRFSIARPPAHTCPPPINGKIPAESAVLIPLMNIDDRAHFLMQVRASFMRVHAGEASFPGGKADETDDDVVHTALREANEELAIRPECVEVLGSLPPEYSLGNRARVWPIVGFLHDSPGYSTSNQSLTSPPVSELVPSPAEVSAILPLPLSRIQSKSYQRTHYFRLAPHRSYTKFMAADLTIPKVDDKLEVWGLSGWFLNVLAWRAGWLDQPPVVDLED